MQYENYNTLDFINDEYFIRWVKDPDEQSERFWKGWIVKHPEKREDIMHARHMIGDLGYKYDPDLTEDDYVEMFEGILKNSRERSVNKPKYNNRFLPLVFKTAAAVAIVIASTFVVLEFLPNRTDPMAKSVTLTKRSPMGQKIITWLEDGTKVHLNSGSSIEYTKKFSDSSRLVHLKGEAYFEVTKDVNRPFIVKTGKVKTTVLGTMFNVRAYPDDDKIEVAVAEGKVKVENDKSISSTFEYTITRNQMASFNIPDQIAVKKDFDPDEILAWTKGIIRFKDANINEIISTLERWYGVTFVINSDLNPDKDFSFSYKNKSLEEILKGLSFAFAFDYKINDKTVTLN